jgi:hypothetical protein
MRTAIEQAGAVPGLLILSRGAEQRIAAEVMTGGAAVVVQMRDDRLRPAVLPDSVFNHVLRTQDIVNLDDASAENPFSAHARLNRGHQSFRYGRNDTPIEAARWWQPVPRCTPDTFFPRGTPQEATNGNVH